jgi:mannose-6-phosphate isomerase-like protein (cupin superfamily)
MNSFWLFSSKLEIVGDQVRTGTDFDVVEGIFPPGTQSPVHVHAQYSETIYVVEGNLTVYIPGESKELKTGDSYFIPKNIPHCLTNPFLDYPCKAIAVASTNGFSKLIRAIGIPVVAGEDSPSGQHDMALAMQIMSEVGDSILAPPGSRP